MTFWRRNPTNKNKVEGKTHRPLSKRASFVLEISPVTCNNRLVERLCKVWLTPQNFFAFYIKAGCLILTTNCASHLST